MERNQMKEFPTPAMRRNWFTLRMLVSKDFKKKYRRSALGVVWSVLNPLLMMVVLAAVFSHFIKFAEIPNFPLYLILGNTIFALMSDSTRDGMASILESTSLIKKIRIEKLIFPLEKVIFHLLNFCFALIAVLMVMLFFRITPTLNVLLLPLLLVYVVLFSAGLSMLLAAAAVYFRDVLHIWTVVITAWTYATPLFYPLEILPGWMQKAEMFNPMYHFVTYFRDIFLYGNTPGLSENLICLAFGVISFAIGFVVFRKLEGKFILYV